MSVWSKSHSDLAKLARTLQDSNSRARRRLTQVAHRARSLSPKTHLSSDTDSSLSEAVNSRTLKTKPVRSVSFHHRSFHSDCKKNGNIDGETLDETSSPLTSSGVYVTSVDGNESCSSDVFQLSSTSDYSEVFPSLTPTPDTAQGQNGDVSDPSKSSPSPTTITSDKSAHLRSSEIFTFTDIIDESFSEADDSRSPEVDGTFSQTTVNSDMTENNFPDKFEMKTTVAPSVTSASVVTNTKPVDSGNQSPKQASGHLSANIDPSSPRLSARSPDLLKKLREVTFSISATKSTHKMKNNKKEKPFLSEFNSLSSVNKLKTVLTNNSKPVPPQKDKSLSWKNTGVSSSGIKTSFSQEEDRQSLQTSEKQLLSESRILSEEKEAFSHMNGTLPLKENRGLSCENEGGLASSEMGTSFSSETEQPSAKEFSSETEQPSAKENDPDLPQIDINAISSERCDNPVSVEDSFKMTVCTHLPPDDNAIHMNGGYMTADSASVDSTSSQENDVSSVQKENKITLDEDLSEKSSKVQSCSEEKNGNTDLKDSSADGLLNTDISCESAYVSTSFSTPMNTSSGQSSSPNCAGSLITTQNELVTLTNATNVTDVYASPISVAEPVTIVSLPLTINNSVFHVTTSSVMSSDNHHRYVLDSFSTVGTAMSVSTSGQQLTVHDMDMRLVPLSAIGIMVGANGLKYELNEKSPRLTLYSPQDATFAKPARSVNENASCLQSAVSIVPSSDVCPSSGVVPTGGEGDITGTAHHRSKEQLSPCHNSVKETRCNSEVVWCHNNTGSIVRSDAAAPCSLSDPSAHRHCLEYSSDERQLDQATTETQTVEMKSDTSNMTAENACDFIHISSMDCSDSSRSPKQPNQSTTETLTMEMTPDLTSLDAETSSGDSSFISWIDRPDSHISNDCPNQGTTETQTVQTESDMTLGIGNSFGDSSFFPRMNCPDSQHSDSKHNQVTTKTQTSKVNSLDVGHLCSFCCSLSKADRHYSAVSDNQSDQVLTTQTAKLKSEVTSFGPGKPYVDSFSFSQTDCVDSSDSPILQNKLSDKSSVKAEDKSAVFTSKEEAVFAGSPEPPSFQKKQSDGVSFNSGRKLSDFSLFGSDAACTGSVELQEIPAKCEKESHEANDVSVITNIQHSDTTGSEMPVSTENIGVRPFSDLIVNERSDICDFSSRLPASHNPQCVHCSVGRQVDREMKRDQSLSDSISSSISVHTQDKFTTNVLSKNVGRQGIPETSTLSCSFSSINGQSLGQTRWTEQSAKVESESETQKSAVSASVQVSHNGTSECKNKSSRSHRRRVRPKEERSHSNIVDLSHSQTSLSSSSFDSLLTMSDNGSGSGYCSDVLNYLTSSSHSQDQLQRPVNRRRLKKLLRLLRFPDQTAAVGVPGLSDFSKTVADLQQLCVFLSRNLEQHTQQQLLEQQRQRLREQQQQLLQERTLQEQSLQQNQQHLQSKQEQEEHQLEGEISQEKLERHQLNQKEQQLQLEPQHQKEKQKVERQKVVEQNLEDTEKQEVTDHLPTKAPLKLRLQNRTQQKEGAHARRRRRCPHAELKIPTPEVALPQKTSRFQSLTAAVLNPEALIEEACKNTELLERLGVDRDVFRPCEEAQSSDVTEQPANTQEQSESREGKQTEDETKQEEGESAVDQKEMETPEETVLKLDEEFDKMLVDMKPHVLKLPHKSDRQRCAVWIKKLCEPPSSGITGRKNRNMYSQLMLHMLKRGSLQAPFDRKPEDGPLHPLPSYMSIYFDEPLERPDDDAEKLPDWVEGELGETVGSSLFRHSEGLGNPAATSTWVSNAGSSMHGVRQRPHTSMGITLDKDPGLSPIRGDHRHHIGYSADDVSIDVRRFPPRSRSPTDRERRQLPDVKANHGSSETKQSDMEWTRPLGATASSTTSFAKGALYQDDTSIAKPGDKEIALRTKMIEAKYHEEKLRLQQKHDSAVQKILDRKNSEIEDVKSHYRSKTKELEETVTKLERKVQTLVKEAGLMRETKDKQIAELKKMVEDSNETQRNEYDKRIHDMEADFEQQKFELQKLHTRNIQEILDDTNARLQRMDAEYNQQASSTASIIKELESRVQQLTGEVDHTLSQRSVLEKEKTELHSRLDQITSDLEEQQHRNNQLERGHQKKMESSEHEMRTLRNKTEASLEFLKQEHSIAAAKASDMIADLEQQVEYLKKALKDAEEQRQRQMRETEQVHQQDKLHLENLHDKQVRSMKKELEQLEQEMQRKLSRLEQLLHDKEAEVQKQKEMGREQASQAEKALEEFKQQVEKNQNQIYADMKQQMDQVEADLKKSKQAREKQSREYSRQIDDIKYKHEHELTEMKMNFDNEKAQMLHEVHVQKEYATSEHERELEQLRETHRNEIKSIEFRFKERQEKDAKMCTELEGQVTELREELVQANQLRKQQLVELGLLREEEKQKMQRDHETEIARQRTEAEQQRLELQKMHSAETERLLEKTNDRLKSIEREYIERGKKSSETITELQNSIKLLREDIKRAKETAENRVTDVRKQSEEERLSLKKQYSSNMSMVQHELESQRNRCHNLDRQIQKLEADHEEKITRLKLDHEEKMRILLPAEMKQELEDTISSLKSQVSTLQQRASMLQEELDLRLKNPLGPFGSRTSSPIKSSV